MFGNEKFGLQNINEPQLFRDMFPYSEPPRITNDDDYNIKPDLPDDIFITDTTFRDGMQARPPYSVDQIVEIYKFLSRLGGPNGVIRKSEFFLYTDKDRAAVEKCRETGLKFPEITGWIRAVKQDFEYVKQMELTETGILTSCSDYHIFLKLKKTREQALEGYLDIVKEALAAGIKPRCHLEDITRADFEGFVIPFAIELQKLSEKSGVDIVIRLCDTMGYGLPFPSSTLPRSVPKMIRMLKEEAGLKSEQLEWHGHNDFHKVIANGVAAWLYGCSAVNGTVLGFGERTGNPPIEGLIVDYIGIKGSMQDIDMTAITDTADYFKKELKTLIPANFPLVGSDFNTTRAGIHADGVMKNEEIYNIFDTDKLLKKPLRVAITDKAGLAGIAFWIEEFYQINNINKRDPGILNIYNEILKEYDNGRITSIADAEMHAYVKEYMPELKLKED